MADIRITPGSSIMNFTSSLNYVETLKQDASGSLNLYGSGSTGRTELFSIDGNNGRLFTVSDDLSDSLFSVNTIAGLPVIEAFANNTVVMGQYGTNALVVSGSNVGIGTASPSSYYKLDVNGDVRISQSISGGGYASSGTSYASYSLTGRVGNYGGFYFSSRNDVDSDALGTAGISVDPDGGINLYCYSLDYNTQSYISFNPYNFIMQSGDDFSFLTKPSTTYQTSLIIKKTGNVGIGTISPSEKLEVNGNIKATSFFESSLRKYKTNIKKFDKSGIDLVDSLEIVTFDRIDSDVKSKIGIIADDTSDEFLSNDKCAVDLYKTVFIQAKAIQELIKEVENLKKNYDNKK